ncbi:hypothetical protein Q8A73_005107 [Channa argus]|nr:hypothetical protein Q8A73_005107 [Channa argus]
MVGFEEALCTSPLERRDEAALLQSERDVGSSHVPSALPGQYSKLKRKWREADFYLRAEACSLCPLSSSIASSSAATGALSSQQGGEGGGGKRVKATCGSSTVQPLWNVEGRPRNNFQRGTKLSVLPLPVRPPAITQSTPRRY